MTRPIFTSWTYILANKPHGTLYVGVTSNLVQRISQHRDGAANGFTKRYGLKRLVYFESHAETRNAIQREKLIKHWSRAWKVQLIETSNPTWGDLYPSLF